MSDEALEFGDPAEDTEGIKDLRKQFSARGKKISALEERLAKYEKQERAKTVGGLLKDKFGVNSGYAKWYTEDDVSEDAVGKWVEENKELVGKIDQGTGTPPPAGQAGSTPPPQQLDANALAALQAAGLSPGIQQVQPPSGPFVGASFEKLQEILDNTPDTPEGYKRLEDLGLVKKSRRRDAF